ncbi:hypothetical protein G6Z25_02120 [Clostridium perfringens]|uniref:hypothetical protein n=1 Tax=Clostridium perfringens TaxID=1502 RepID=UPI0013E38C3D|nr:hypothetical protein [Clostridium perfringens]NGS95715.1 hypothetical protein [Clostridium perfringens]
MLLREIQNIILTFDDEKEVLKKYQELLQDDTVIERSRIYKDYSEIFEKWVYKISYKKDTLKLNKNY